MLFFYSIFIFFLLSVLDATLDNSILPFLTVKKDKWQYQQGCENVKTTLQDQTKSLPGLVSGGFLGKSRRKTLSNISPFYLGSLIHLVALHVTVILVDSFLPLVCPVPF